MRAHRRLSRYSANGEQAESHTELQGLGNAAGYVVVQPNSPGVGWDHSTDPLRVRSFLDQLIGTVDIDKDRVHVGGHSQGGPCGMEFRL